MVSSSWLIVALVVVGSILVGPLAFIWPNPSQSWKVWPEETIEKSGTFLLEGTFLEGSHPDMGSCQGRDNHSPASPVTMGGQLNHTVGHQSLEDLPAVDDLIPILPSLSREQLSPPQPLPIGEVNITSHPLCEGPQWSFLG